ncbi:MAG: Maf family protein [Acidobacteriota bacterium]|nr:Maf family protein [Acidobacteriota bacterium]
MLASRSVRRADLLSRAGFRFDVVPADIDERPHPEEPPAVLVRRLAREKAAAVALSHPDAVVLGADTLVVAGGTIFGKPVDAGDATTMLRRLSGQTHDVLTGVAVHTPTGWRDDVASTRVVFRELHEVEIDWYVASEEPLGKAGAYAIQGLASRFVTRIDGSYTNVVGLPIEVVDRMLRELSSPA